MLVNKSDKIIEFAKKGMCDIEEDAVIDSIWNARAVHSFLDEETTNERIEVIQSYFKTLSRKRRRVVLARIFDLCMEHEHAAFIEGIRVGGRLVMEILDEGETAKNEEGDG